MSDLVEMLDESVEHQRAGTRSYLFARARDEITRLRGRVEEGERRIAAAEAENDSLQRAWAVDKSYIDLVNAKLDTATLALSDLRAALERLGSTEAFCVSRAIGPADEELVARITLAQAALSQTLTADKEGEGK